MSSVSLNKADSGFRDVRRSLVAARCEAWPVVEVDDAHFALGRDDAVASVDDHVKLLGSTLADVFHLLEVELYALRLAIDSLVAIFAVTFAR